jgi:RimJ/RimL family protein N-acetyltransferase
MPSAAVLERFIAAVESNRHAEAIEEFYTADASMQENNLPPRRGRDALVASERKVLARMKSVRSQCMRPVLVNGDLAVVRWIFEFETLEGARIRMEELAYQRWEADQIAEERFFYDPVQRVPFLFEGGSWRAREMGEADIARLQAFYQANPQYHLSVNGVPPSPAQAREEWDSPLPPDFPYEKRWMIDIAAPDGSMAAMASVVSNMLVEGVWHIGLFIVATSLHGAGAAREMYDALEAWMRERGAQWIRLGVVAGNRRAERFWEKMGFVEVRRRLAVPMGARVNEIRVMVKPLAGGAIETYLAKVVRDRPETP